MTDTDEETTVAVTSNGQATIPRRFRDKLHIDTPGRVRFVENDDGDVVARPVERPSDLRGALATDASEGPERPATELLRDERAQEGTETDERHGLSERDARRWSSTPNRYSHSPSMRPEPTRLRRTRSSGGSSNGSATARYDHAGKQYRSTNRTGPLLAGTIRGRQPQPSYSFCPGVYGQICASETGRTSSRT